MVKLDQELIRTFNCNNYMKGIILTNCKYAVGKNPADCYVTMKVDKGIDVYDYFRDLSKHIIEAFHANEAGAKTCFYLNSFPFAIPSPRMCESQGDGTVIVKFPITQEVRYNLKCHLVNSIKKTILVAFDFDAIPLVFDRNKYITASSFESPALAQDFADRFLERMGREDEDPKRTLEVIGNKVYIKDICDAEFVKDYGNAMASRMGQNVEYYEKDNRRKEGLYSLITQFMSSVIDAKVGTYSISGYRVDNDKGIFIPIISNRYLESEECQNINDAFRKINGIKDREFNILSDVTCCVRNDGIFLNWPGYKDECGIYGIDFFNHDIAGCVVKTVFENSVVVQVAQVMKSAELSNNYELTICNAKCLDYVVSNTHQYTPKHIRRIESHSPDKNKGQFSRESSFIGVGSDSGRFSTRQTSGNTLLPYSDLSGSSLPGHSGSDILQNTGDRRLCSVIQGSSSGSGDSLSNRSKSFSSSGSQQHERSSSAHKQRLLSPPNTSLTNSTLSTIEDKKKCPAMSPCPNKSSEKKVGLLKRLGSCFGLG